MKRKHVFQCVFTVFFIFLLVSVFGILIMSKRNQNSLEKEFQAVQKEEQMSDQEPDQNMPDMQTETEADTYLESEAEMSYTKDNNQEYKEDIEIDKDTEMEDVSLEEAFFSIELNDEIRERITGISYPDTKEPIQISYEELRYIGVLYYDFNGEVQKGELICNEMIADKLLVIFRTLFENQYQIESVKLVDEFQGDDEASMSANNSSCFNYRTIAGTDKISNHSYGLAIDINPRYNPYITYRNGGTQIQPENGVEFADRTADFEHKITEEDLCYQLFIQNGFTWGGAWKNSKDYQHFEYKK